MVTIEVSNHASFKKLYEPAAKHFEVNYELSIKFKPRGKGSILQEKGFQEIVKRRNVIKKLEVNNSASLKKVYVPEYKRLYLASIIEAQVSCIGKYNKKLNTKRSRTEKKMPTHLIPLNLSLQLDNKKLNWIWESGISVMFVEDGRAIDNR